MVDVEVAIGKLKAAGQDFDTMGEKMKSASSKAGEIDLTKKELAYLGEQQGVITAYEDVQKFMVDILADGQEALEAIGEALVTAAKEYEADEEAGKHKVEDAAGD